MNNQEKIKDDDVKWFFEKFGNTYIVRNIPDPDLDGSSWSFTANELYTFFKKRLTEEEKEL